MVGCGIKESELAFFEQHAVEPDVLGLNYYITSERWLDERIEKYHPDTWGGNGKHRYADTEVVRAAGEEPSGLKQLSAEIWERYAIPLAITEVHLHCTREEQMRWFREILDEAVRLTQCGIEVKGVTAWALLGSFDWDTLLTKTGTQYESGVFDVMTLPGALRPTAMADLIKQIAEGKTDFHPVLSGQGWWHDQPASGSENAKKIVIVKGAGQGIIQQEKLVKLIQKASSLRRLNTVVVNQTKEIDFKQISPWSIISLGETDARLASFCAGRNIQYVTFCDEGDLSTGLCIHTGGEKISIHQINKVLDLMIDGDQESWAFEAGSVTLKTENLMAGE
jgi:hypothetical protein